ncbi:MAG: response regulator transcription factor [Kiritimatiellae bacterium]|nr:response regulator transcription factor [Kiritimatiellia bacterium]
MKKTQILIADDHAVMRMGLTALFDTVPEFKIIGEASTGLEAVDKAHALKPDIIIMDLMMPIMDGVAATRKIQQDIPETKVLLLTTFGTSDGIAQALAAGATGAILKSASNEELIAAVHTVASGKLFIAKDVQQLLKSEPPVQPLTERQLEILSFVTRGLTNQDIAKALGIRVDSVGQNLSTIFAKLGAANRAEATSIALRKQLLKI